VVVVICAGVALGGCSALMSSATGSMADSLSSALVNHNDPETVRQAAPAYLVLIDGMIADNPDGADVLLAGAELYSSYAAAFVEDPERARKLAVIGRDYGWRGLCSAKKSMCGSVTAPYDEFEAALKTLGPKDVEAAFVAASAWTTWIRTHRDDWSAIADKARVDALMRRVVELDPNYREGSAYLYLGALESLLPAAMGGRPEEGRRHFETAIELSGGRNLMAKTLLASEYARMVFDRELHDRLCREVLEADPVHPGFTLSNTIAQEDARRLLEDSQDYFGE
jgi:tetratricopeptide (TPR) repeat protein